MKDDNNINDNDMNKFEENMNNYNVENSVEFVNMMDSIKDKENAGDILMEWIFSYCLYEMTVTDLQIHEYEDYTIALEYLCEKKEYVKECKMYAYVLNTYYPTRMREMIDELIKEEKYEKCQALKEYMNIKDFPNIER